MSAGHNTLADLSRHLEHSHPAILRHVDKLEELGFVERTAHPEDRRVKILVITEKGQQTAKALQEMARTYSKEIEEKFGKERVAAAAMLLKDIVTEYSDIDFMGCPKGQEE
jgi:DNA-binding MarR family transcriptional regulator